MMNRSRCFAIVSLIWGLFCFQNAVGRRIVPHDSIPPNPALQGFGADVGLNADTGGFVGADLSVKAFSDILLSQLMNNGAFLNLFSSQLNEDITASIAISIAQALVTELGLADLYLAINLLTNALTGINPSAGPENFGKALCKAIGLMLFNSGFLNTSDTYLLANRISRTIINASLKFIRGDSGIGLSLGTGLGWGAGINADADLGLGLNTGVGLGSNLGWESNLGLGANLDSGTDANLGIGLDAGAVFGVGLGLRTDINAVVKKGLDVDLTLSTDVVLQFKSGLKNELLKDKYFKYVFSDYIPQSALNTVAAAIAQYLSKAFGLPRSTLLPLEKNISALIINKTLTLETYADLIASCLANILADANIIVNSAAMLQITIASKAISSGISNFLGVSSIPGVGLSITSNSYNYFFSVLSGLEKLPYVGIDSVSRKVPPILEIAKSSSFALQFAKILFYNLVSSTKFYETFSLGVPVSAYKIIANTLGKYMAEAFGSQSPSIYSDIYTSALLTTTGKLNYKTYARALAVATARALYSLGYFLSGNANIQAAIATNAIIRALITKLQQRPETLQTILYQNVLRLPPMTPLTGVAPPELILKGNSGLGANLGPTQGLGLGADLNLGANVGKGTNLGIDANLGVNSNIGNGASIGAGLNAAANVGTNLGGDLDSNIKDALGVMSIDDYLSANVPLNVRAEADLAKKLRRKRDLTNGNDFTNYYNPGLNSDVTLLGDVNTSTFVGEKTGADLGVKAGLGVGADAGLGAVAGANLGVKAGLGVGADAGLGAFADANLGVKTGLRAGVGTETQPSILNVLPQMLANKLHISTALCTAFTTVGIRKVFNLIAQAMAFEFGFPVAAVFLKSCENVFTNSTDNSYGKSVVVLASATTVGLTATGILNSSFTVKLADQLATAIVAKYSSLIATSLEAREWNLKPIWTNIYDGDQQDTVWCA